LLAEIVGESLEAAADGGFMHGQSLRDLEQSLAVEIVGGEEEAVFGLDAAKSAGNGGCELGQV